MLCRKTLLTASIIAGLCLSGTVYAAGYGRADQDTSPKEADKDKPKELGTVTVTGIRSSQELSLDTKQAAESHVEVVSAEDIGKLPAKNVADTIAQIPGVNISDAAGAEGGFDEADRASLRGGAPSLNWYPIPSTHNGDNSEGII